MYEHDFPNHVVRLDLKASTPLYSSSKGLWSAELST